MRRVACFHVPASRFACAVLLLAATLAGCPAGAFAAGAPPLLGIVDHSTYGGNGMLVRLDRGTLRPSPTHRVVLGSFEDGWSLSPDNRELAVGFANPSCVGGSTALRFIDTARMRRLGDVPLLPNGTVEATDWLDATHVLAVVQASDCVSDKGFSVFAIDAATRTVSSRRPIPGRVVAVARARGAIVLLLAPRDRIGAARIAVVGRGGVIRVAAAGVQAGFRPLRSGGRLRTDVPGLAVSRNDAYVVPAIGPLVRVDLRTLRVESLGARKARTLQKGATGPLRTAVPLGNGLLAVTGWNVGETSAGLRAVPAGLELVDPKTRRYRLLDPDTSRIALTSGALIGDSDGATPTGLTAYTEHGRVRYRLYPGQPVSFIGAVADRGYAAIGTGRGERVVAFNVQTGRPVSAGDAAAAWGLLFGTHATFTAAGF